VIVDIVIDTADFPPSYCLFFPVRYRLLFEHHYVRTGEAEIYTDGSMDIRPQHTPPFHIPSSAISKLFSFNPDPSNIVALLHFDLEPGFKLPICLTNSQVALSFFPQTSAWKTFNNVVSDVFII